MNTKIGFVYGIPVFLIGLSLWYGELSPVEVITSEAGDRAWEKKATDTLIKVRHLFCNVCDLNNSSR